ncbi:MAG: hypothetical protein JNJ73_12525 [Hyphomonadaceae bacterium]|nr:hypothetical protein [Hyphomonadaceae bacterium]
MKRLAASIALLLAACAPAARPAADAAPHVVGGDAVATGRYIALVGGCNDCHTAYYPDSNGETPEAEWLKGSPIGHYGPWGTTYPSNLRLVAASMDEDQWVETVSTARYRPPMPWYLLHQYNHADLRALYQYIRQLPGDPGVAMPTALPPAPTPPPTGPYYDYTHGGPPPPASAPPSP